MVTIEWQDGHPAVMHWKFEGEWSWQEIAGYLAESAEMTRGRGHYITLLDFSQAIASPGNATGVLPLLTSALQTRSHWPDRVLIVGATPFIEMLGEITSQVYRLRLFYFDNREEALNALQEPD